MQLEQYFFCVIYFLLFIGVSELQKKIYRSRRTPLTFFSLIWCIVGFCVNTNIMNYEKPSFFVNVCIVSGIVVFSTIFVILTSKSKIIITDDKMFHNTEIVNYYAIIIVGIFCWVLIIPKFSSSLQVLSNQGFAFLRANMTNEELGISRGGFQDILFAYIVEPAITTTAILSFFLLFSNENKKKKYTLFAYSLITVFVYALTAAARSIIIKYAFCFLFVVMICKRKVIRNLFRIRAVRYGLILAAGVVIYITLQRGTWGEADTGLNSLLKTAYVYYFSGPAYMTKLIEAQPQYGGFGQLLFGQGTFGFITNFISWILIFFTGRNQGSLYLLGSVITNQYYNVAPNVTINAMCTCFYIFWIDWGYFGIVLGPLLLGLYSAYLFKKTYKVGSYYYGVMYVFWLYLLTRTVFKLDTTTVAIPIVYLCMKIFVRRVENVADSMARIE